MIVAAAKNGIIGNNNELLWHLPNDFKFFKKHTTGHPVIMGRLTFESIGRPLPGRTNIVISRNNAYKPEGVEVVDNLNSALEIALKIDESPFIIGGASVYQQAYSLTNKLFLTVVDCELEGDAYFKFPDLTQWKLIEEESHSADDKHRYAYTFKIFERKN